MFCNFDLNRNFLALTQVCHWVAVHFWHVCVSEFEIEMCDHVNKNSFDVLFSKCLTNAAAFTTVKRCVTEWVPFLAIRGEIKRALRVESVGQELIWTLPFLRIVVQSVVVDDNLVLLLNLDRAKSCVLCQIDIRAGVCWSLESECFLEAH